MSLLIVGILLAIIGLPPRILKGKKAGQVAVLEFNDTSTVSAVNENYQSTTDSLGRGSFTHFVELKGKLMQILH